LFLNLNKEEEVPTITESLKGIQNAVIDEKIEKKAIQQELIKLRGRTVGSGKHIGNCIICDTMIEDGKLTCEHPQCDKEIREIVANQEDVEDILELLDVGNLFQARKRIQEIIDLVEEIEREVYEDE
jgi:hypothetical protein